MSVELDPAEQLEFNRTFPSLLERQKAQQHPFGVGANTDLVGPFTQQVARYLKVRNLHDTPVAYKVKTTAPRRYVI